MKTEKFAGSLEAMFCRDNWEEIKKLYWDKWIAVQGKKIIDADFDHDKLDDRIENQPHLTWKVNFDVFEMDEHSWGFIYQ